ncbi:very-long-chain 3-oxoacyl-CoA reductase-B-like [Pelodytes ibericus]
MSEEESGICTQALSLFGALVTFYIVVTQGWKLIRGIRNHFLSEWWRTDLKKYGGWAVVTGASDGIGKEYARELAKRGIDVVLISRTLEKLKNVATEIEQEFGRKTKIIQTDFTRGLEMYQSIEDELKGLKIGILVNNVGMMMYHSSKRFLDIPNFNEALVSTINCNVLSVVQMTRIVLPQMVERKKGLIVNLSSEVGNRPYPMTLVYSASKVFVDFFSRGLNSEYASRGVTVQSVMPLLVSSAMTQKIKPNIFMKSANDFAREALNTVGYATRTSGCLSHSLQSYALDLLLPEPLFTALISMTLPTAKSNKERKDHKKEK